MSETNIEWTATVMPDGSTVPGFSFNPWWGCAEISPGCKNCYARSLANRLLPNHPTLWQPNGERRFFGEEHWTGPLRWERKAVKTGVRFKVFCASMADVFDNADDLSPVREMLWELIRKTPHLDWLILTKRIGNAKTMLPADWGDGYANVWLGSSIVNQAEADRDIPKLLAVPARIRFLSCEPLLASIDLRRFLNDQIGRGFPVPSGDGLVLGDGGRLDLEERGISRRPSLHNGVDYATSGRDQQLGRERLPADHVPAPGATTMGQRSSDRMDLSQQATDTERHGSEPQGRRQEESSSRESGTTYASGKRQTRDTYIGAQAEGAGRGIECAGEADRAASSRDSSIVGSEGAISTRTGGAIRNDAELNLSDRPTPLLGSHLGIAWIICGGESGHKSRPMEIEWARSLKDQCAAAGTAFFMKQGSRANWPDFKNLESFPADLQVRQWPT